MTAIAERYDTPSLPQMGAGLISVLIVDDDPDAVDELSEALEGFGFRCFQAASPDEAIQVIDEEPRISAIVTDFYLRGLATSADNGLLLIERVRETFPDRSFDCVVVSGDPDILAECALSGAVKFLAKPILPESLTAMLLTPARPAQPDTPVSLVLLHRLLESQSNTIATLTEALNASNQAHRIDTEEALSRLDRLTDAAKIANKRTNGGENKDVTALLGYIAGQGSAVKSLLRDRKKSF